MTLSFFYSSSKRKVDGVDVYRWFSFVPCCMLIYHCFSFLCDAFLEDTGF
jgi:hypothetical protein